MKIAFATSDYQHINAHFGWAEILSVYEVSPEGYRLIEHHHFPLGQEDGNEDKLVPKLDFLESCQDCKIVYVSAIGGSAAARLINKGITPIKAPSEEEGIISTLDRLVHTLQTSPPPWLRKALGLKPKFTEE
ncbi:MAG: nitrogen fixation protein NifX [Pseudanabaenaceae cyanobacterium SKYGB_i_bin29]|nr:nitrogen fixation protein NifX [Pseudanabaenaceae cyanobacterium SKYG29]MDW8422234.1 nitrogen fixation protein NifX [Pseudanabaenaceae cyanobacterium SKYGB_i_bin29]